jgi:hypothetical protein
VDTAIARAKWATFGAADFADYVREFIAKPEHFGGDEATARTLQDEIIHHCREHSLKPYAAEWDGPSGFWMKQAIDVRLLFFAKIFEKKNL